MLYGISIVVEPNGFTSFYLPRTALIQVLWVLILISQSILPMTEIYDHTILIVFLIAEGTHPPPNKQRFHPHPLSLDIKIR